MGDWWQWWDLERAEVREDEDESEEKRKTGGEVGEGPRWPPCGSTRLRQMAAGAQSSTTWIPLLDFIKTPPHRPCRRTTTTSDPKSGPRYIKPRYIERLFTLHPDCNSTGSYSSTDPALLWRVRVDIP